MSEVPIKAGSWDYLEPAADLLGRAFDKDPVLRFLLCNLPDDEVQEYLPRYWRSLGRAALLNKAVIYEADGWKAATFVLPPGKSVDNPLTIIPAALGSLSVLWRIGLAGLMRMLGDYSGSTDAVKRKAIGKQKYLYVLSVGTEHEHRRKGLAKALMRPLQDEAWRLELPIWLEATTESCRQLYLSLGFEDVEKIMMGVGKNAPDGTMEIGGQGVSLWAMIWWPQPCATKRNSTAGPGEQSTTPT
ncbi:hypothetical protein BJX70DRAFT_383851 [Aspergillus crustosus]